MILKVIDVLAQSEKSWEDAAQMVLKESSKTIRNIKSMEITDFKVAVENNKIKGYRLNAKLSFLYEKKS